MFWHIVVIEHFLQTNKNKGYNVFYRPMILSFILIYVLCNNTENPSKITNEPQHLFADIQVIEEKYHKDKLVSSSELSNEFNDYYSNNATLKEIIIQDNIVYWKIDNKLIGCSTKEYIDSLSFTTIGFYDENLNSTCAIEDKINFKLEGNINSFKGEYFHVNAYNDNKIESIFNITPFSYFSLDSIKIKYDSTTIYRVMYEFN